MLCDGATLCFLIISDAFLFFLDSVLNILPLRARGNVRKFFINLFREYCLF